MSSPFPSPRTRAASPASPTRRSTDSGRGPSARRSAGTTQPRAGHHTVDDSARRIRNHRYVEERMMRILGGWIALTPELPAKLLFGRHIWDCAQHADAWGRRLPELRSPAQQSEPANDRMVKFADLVESVEGPRETIERVAGVYRVLKPHLV